MEFYYYYLYFDNLSKKSTNYIAFNPNKNVHIFNKKVLFIENLKFKNILKSNFFKNIFSKKDIYISTKHFT